jgi:hypothetical protein
MTSNKQTKCAECFKTTNVLTDVVNDNKYYKCTSKRCVNCSMQKYKGYKLQCEPNIVVNHNIGHIQHVLTRTSDDFYFFKQNALNDINELRSIIDKQGLMINELIKDKYKNKNSYTPKFRPCGLTKSNRSDDDRSDDDTRSITSDDDRSDDDTSDSDTSDSDTSDDDRSIMAVTSINPKNNINLENMLNINKEDIIKLQYVIKNGGIGLVDNMRNDLNRLIEKNYQNVINDKTNKINKLKEAKSLLLTVGLYAQVAQLDLDIKKYESSK